MAAPASDFTPQFLFPLRCAEFRPRFFRPLLFPSAVYPLAKKYAPLSTRRRYIDSPISRPFEPRGRIESRHVEFLFCPLHVEPQGGMKQCAVQRIKIEPGEIDFTVAIVRFFTIFNPSRFSELIYYFELEHYWRRNVPKLPLVSKYFDLYEY